MITEIKNIIKDTSAIIDLLDSFKHDIELHYVVVPKVKIRNRINRNQQLVKDIIFMARPQTRPLKPMTLVGIYNSETQDLYLSHWDITHWNMQGGIERMDFGKFVIFYRLFCNPVLQKEIIDEPTKARAMLTGNLMEGNPNDSYRNPDSVDVDRPTPRYSYLRTGATIKCNDPHINLLTRCVTPTEPEFNRRLGEAITNIKKGLYYVCGTRIKNLDDLYGNELHYKWMTKEQIDSPLFIMSDYYPTISQENFNPDEVKIPRQGFDVVCCGCGSAGTQMLDQISRLNYYKDYLLVDIDTVEIKNLRNQIYITNDVGRYKVAALADHLHRINTVGTVSTLREYVQDISWEFYKTNILINGFDNIEARLYMLEQVENKKLLANYIIDARYDHLSADLYMIDMNNPEEVKLYKEQLLADKEAFAEEEKNKYVNLDDEDAIMQWLDSKNVFTSKCSDVSRNLNLPSLCCRGRCRGEECKKVWIEAIRTHNCRLPLDKPEDEGCVEQNIIHIYKYVSSWVTCNISSIETDKKKLFTQVMCSVEPLPKAIVVRK